MSTSASDAIRLHSLASASQGCAWVVALLEQADCHVCRCPGIAAEVPSSTTPLIHATIREPGRHGHTVRARWGFDSRFSSTMRAEGAQSVLLERI